MSQRWQRFWYSQLFVLLISSAILFASTLLAGHAHLWRLFAFAYVAVLIIDTWLMYLLLLRTELAPPHYPPYAGEEIAVLIACYNEDPDLLERALASVAGADGNKRVFVVDDGSTNGIHARLQELCDRYGMSVSFRPQNAGKRQALRYAAAGLPETADFVVTIDSDTVLDPAALIRVVEPLKAGRIAASTGDVRLLNEWRNAITRMVGAYYWIGLNLYKRALSGVGSVSCCSGCLAAYRKEVFVAIIDDFASQRFLGTICTHSEDRHLTNLVLRLGHDVVYVPEAISFTLTPHTLAGFVRQQLRWKRGFVRESLFTASYGWRNKRLLFCQIVFWDLTAPYVTLALRLAMVGLLVTDPMYFVSSIVPAVAAFLVVRYSLLFVRAPRKIAGIFIYAVLYEAVLYWVNLWALFTVKNGSWLTRGPASGHPRGAATDFGSSIL